MSKGRDAILQVIVGVDCTVIDKAHETADRVMNLLRNRGFAIVPIEPNDEIVAAGFSIHPCAPGESKISDAYKAMVRKGTQ